MRRGLFAFLTVLVAGCYEVPTKQRTGLASFQVVTKNVYVASDSAGARVPAAVVTDCQKKYGGENKVPAEVRGQPDCRFAISPTAIDIEVEVTALDTTGKPLSIDRPVAFRVKPGDLDGDYDHRSARLSGGRATALVRVRHVSSDVRVWAEDAPVKTIPLEDGGIGGTASLLPETPSDLTYATGLSDVIAFEEPTLALIQKPDDGSSRTNPFVSQFVSIGSGSSTAAHLQSCTDDPERDGQPVKMIVTGVDSAGFFLTDLTACRQKEPALPFSAPEPDGFLPGTYGSIYVYNSSFPEGIDPGDWVGSLAGSVQEFTSTSQLTFASWSVAEHVRELPESEWNKYLDLVPVHPITARTCGLDKTLTPFVNDGLCAYSYSNLKMESMESTLVKVSNVRMPNAMTACDFNGDGQVPFFCPFQNKWQACFAVDGPDPDLAERSCNIDCTIGQNAFFGKVCSERSTYHGFGQYVVEMAPPGLAAAHLDDSIAERFQTVTLLGASVRPDTGYGADVELAVACTADARLHFGPDSVTATSIDPVTPAKTVVRHTLTGSETTVAVLGTGTSGTCSVSQNPKTRILLLTRDAIPDLELDCDENSADAAAAAQCRNLRGATFDVTGHLRQVAPARPRWMVIPRDADDVCCRPGPGLACPEPIRTCP